MSPNFLVWKFCGKAQFLHSFRRFSQILGILYRIAYTVKFSWHRGSWVICGATHTLWWYHSIFLWWCQNMFSKFRVHRENLLWRMKLFELPILESGDLNLKALAFKLLIVLLLCYNSNSSPAVANVLYQYWKDKVKALQLLYSIYSRYC